MSKGKQSKDRILVAYDGSSNAARALRRAVDIAERNRGTIHVVRAIEATFGMGSPMSPELAPMMQLQLQENTEASLYVAIEGRMPVENASVEIVVGDIVEAVLEAVTRHRPTLVILGSHGDLVEQAPPKLGHVPLALIERCPCSVLVVRPTYQLVDRKTMELTPEPPCPHCVEAKKRLQSVDALCAVHEQQELPYESPLRTEAKPGLEQQRQNAWILA